jgi:hypothetical protein
VRHRQRHSKAEQADRGAQRVAKHTKQDRVAHGDHWQEETGYAPDRHGDRAPTHSAQAACRSRNNSASTGVRPGALLFETSTTAYFCT